MERERKMNVGVQEQSVDASEKGLGGFVRERGDDKKMTMWGHRGPFE